jgi:GrpB-like predicted nucleotidyltransferase (UPF0157 family)
MELTRKPHPEPIVVVPYDPRWPVVFEALREVFRRALGELAIGFEHVGSTAVPGLPAKPILDIDVVVSARSQIPQTIARLATLGYRHEGDLGIPGREAFARDGAEDVPRDGTDRRWPDHHLYLCLADSRELRRHLTFRDWLRSHSESAAAYGKLKLHLAEVHGGDRTRYTEGKMEFVEAALREAGEPSNVAARRPLLS